MDRLKPFPLTEQITSRKLINGSLVAAMIFLGACNDGGEPTREPVLWVPERIRCGNGEGYVTHEEDGWAFHDERIIEDEPQIRRGIFSQAEAIGHCTTEGIRSQGK